MDTAPTKIPLKSPGSTNPLTIRGMNHQVLGALRTRSLRRSRRDEDAEVVVTQHRNVIDLTSGRCRDHMYTYIIYILYTYYIHIIYILYTYYIHIIYILYTYYIHIIYILYTYYIHIIYILYTYYIHIHISLQVCLNAWMRYALSPCFPQVSGVCFYFWSLKLNFRHYAKYANFEK